MCVKQVTVSISVATNKTTWSQMHPDFIVFLNVFRWPQASPIFPILDPRLKTFKFSITDIEAHPCVKQWWQVSCLLWTCTHCSCFQMPVLPHENMRDLSVWKKRWRQQCLQNNFSVTAHNLHKTPRKIFCVLGGNRMLVMLLSLDSDSVSFV